MNQFAVACDDYSSNYPLAFHSIIEAGIREAAANNLDGISLKLSHFCITGTNIRDLKLIWSTNTSNVQSLLVDTTLLIFTLMRSLERDEPTFPIGFNLSSCQKFESLTLRGKDIWLRGKG
ncbi:hypothetical protein DPMN_143130 [Dreissena polymorpha]|uniref:Uncharacterized protein n=1 Tax=Dreissena polymorpha TaxID=45954 RepID=A0A9D4JJT1_DREPO|nr:hypothetical protein DPMN_143130 [Dreissena polymorpha]